MFVKEQERSLITVAQGNEYVFPREQSIVWIAEEQEYTIALNAQALESGMRMDV